VDVVLGVSVKDKEGRLALVGAGDDSRAVIDQCLIDLAGAEASAGADPTDEIATTILGTRQQLADNHHRLVATRVCWSGRQDLNALRAKLVRAGVDDVTVLSESQAATALVRESARSAGHDRSALLLLADDTATLSIVAPDDSPTTVVGAEDLDGADAATVCSELIDRLRQAPGAADDVVIVSSQRDTAAVIDELQATSAMPVSVPEQPDFAIARGAALAGAPTAPPEAVETMLSPQLGPNLAYSAEKKPLDGDYLEAEAGVPMQTALSPMGDPATGDAAEEEVAVAAGGRRSRFVLVGSTLAGLGVLAVAALAVSMAVGINPMVNQQPATQEPDGGTTFSPGQQNQKPRWGQAPQPQHEVVPPPGQGGAEGTAGTGDPGSAGTGQVLQQGSGGSDGSAVPGGISSGDQPVAQGDYPALPPPPPPPPAGQVPLPPFQINLPPIQIPQVIRPPESGNRNTVNTDNGNSNFKPPVNDNPKPITDPKPDNPVPPVNDSPKAPVNDSPKAPVNDSPKPPVNDSPKPPVNDSLKPPVNDNSTPPVNQNSAPPVNQGSVPGGSSSAGSGNSSTPSSPSPSGGLRLPKLPWPPNGSGG
jgi:hypothetical protein